MILLFLISKRLKTCLMRSLTISEFPASFHLKNWLALLITGNRRSLIPFVSIMVSGFPTVLLKAGILWLKRSWNWLTVTPISTVSVTGSFTLLTGILITLFIKNMGSNPTLDYCPFLPVFVGNPHASLHYPMKKTCWAGLLNYFLLTPIDCSCRANLSP